MTTSSSEGPPLSAQWDRKTKNPLIRRVMHSSIEAKDPVAGFQENPVTYERMRKHARQEVSKLIEFARLSAASPGPLPDIRPIEGDIDF